uniref:Reverse transcriptase domain-containing protein n=1 Tax=Tanacetum cinerariifolium TaxID=118510 RepID=A0A6L2MK78_TANCI|nr:reverse transcriptase domain-containing protein [Tanacetum cinerariifolium]
MGKQERERRTCRNYLKCEESRVRIKCGSISKKKKSNYSSYQDLRSSCNEDMVKYEGPRLSTTLASALNEKSNKKIPPATSQPPGWRVCHPAEAPTLEAAVVAVDLVDNFTVKGHHLSMIKDRQFNGRSRANPHKHIIEFVEVCGMFCYGDTNVDAIKPKLFPSSLAREAKIWFNELSPGVISTWEEMIQAFVSQYFPPAMFNRLMEEIREFTQQQKESLVDAWLHMKDLLRSCHGNGLGPGTIIQIFYHGLDEPIQAILDAEGIFL